MGTHSLLLGLAIALSLAGCKSDTADTRSGSADLIRIALQGRSHFLDVIGTRARLDHQHMLEAHAPGIARHKVFCYLVTRDYGLALVTFRDEEAESVFWTARPKATNKLRDLSSRYFSTDIKEE